MPLSTRNRKRARWIAILSGLLLFNCFLLYWWHDKTEKKYDREILGAALRYGLDPALVKAVVWRESKFNPSVRGKAGEIGLMQVCAPAAGEWAEAEKLRFFSHSEIFDPRKNLRAGSWYLAKLMKRYKKTDNPVPYALADYNAGRGNVLRWLKGAAETNSKAFLASMDYPGTRNYAVAIMKRQSLYKKEFANPKALAMSVEAP